MENNLQSGKVRVEKPFIVVDFGCKRRSVTLNLNLRTSKPMH